MTKKDEWGDRDAPRKNWTGYDKLKAGDKVKEPSDKDLQSIVDKMRGNASSDMSKEEEGLVNAEGEHLMRKADAKLLASIVRDEIRKVASTATPNVSVPANSTTIRASAKNERDDYATYSQKVSRAEVEQAKADAIREKTRQSKDSFNNDPKRRSQLVAQGRVDELDGSPTSTEIEAKSKATDDAYDAQVQRANARNGFIKADCAHTSKPNYRNIRYDGDDDEDDEVKKAYQRQGLNQQLGRQWQENADKVEGVKQQDRQRIKSNLGQDLGEVANSHDTNQGKLFQESEARSKAKVDEANANVKTDDRQAESTPDNNQYARDAGYSLRQGSGLRQMADADEQYVKDQVYHSGKMAETQRKAKLYSTTGVDTFNKAIERIQKASRGVARDNMGSNGEETDVIEEQGVASAPKVNADGAVKKPGAKQLGQAPPAAQPQQPQQNPNGPEPVRSAITELEAADRKLQGIEQPLDNTPLEDQRPKDSGRYKSAKQQQAQAKNAQPAPNPNLPTQQAAQQQQAVEQMTQAVTTGIEQGLQRVMTQMNEMLGRGTHYQRKDQRFDIESKNSGRERLIAPRRKPTGEQAFRGGANEGAYTEKESLGPLRGPVESELVPTKVKKKPEVEPFKSTVNDIKVPIKEGQVITRQSPRERNLEQRKKRYMGRFNEPLADDMATKQQTKPEAKAPADYKARPLNAPDLQPGDQYIDPSEGQLSAKEKQYHKKATRISGGASPREKLKYNRETGKLERKRSSGNPFVGSGVAVRQDVKDQRRRDLRFIGENVGHGETKQSLKFDYFEGKDGKRKAVWTGSHIEPEAYAKPEVDENGEPVLITAYNPHSKKNIRLAPTNTDKGYYWYLNPDTKQFTTVHAPNYDGPVNNGIITSKLAGAGQEPRGVGNKIRTVPASRAGLKHANYELDVRNYEKSPGERKDEKWRAKYRQQAEVYDRNKAQSREYVERGRSLADKAGMKIPDELPAGHSYVVIDQSRKGYQPKEVAYFRDPDELYHFMGLGTTTRTSKVKGKNVEEELRFDRRKARAGKYSISTAVAPNDHDKVPNATAAPSETARYVKPDKPTDEERADMAEAKGQVKDDDILSAPEFRGKNEGKSEDREFFETTLAGAKEAAGRGSYREAVFELDKLINFALKGKATKGGVPRPHMGLARKLYAVKQKLMGKISMSPRTQETVRPNERQYIENQNKRRGELDAMEQANLRERKATRALASHEGEISGIQTAIDEATERGNTKLAEELGAVKTRIEVLMDEARSIIEGSQDEQKDNKNAQKQRLREQPGFGGLTGKSKEQAKVVKKRVTEKKDEKRSKTQRKLAKAMSRL